MPAPAPIFVPRPFAENAAAQYRNSIPLVPAGTQRASFQLGFPPLTMTPVVAGGRPMLGPDMNGILYMLSSHTVYAQSGQPYKYSADVVNAIAGYAVGTILGSTGPAVANNLTLWFNTLDGNGSDPDAGGAGWVPMYSYGMTTIPNLNGGVRNLTAAEAQRPVIVLTGALAGNLQIVIPNPPTVANAGAFRRWLIINATSGAFTTQVRTTSGTGVTVPQGGFNGPVEVWSDGINIYNVVAPVNLPIDQGPTGGTIAQRTNAGYLLATYFNQNSPQENFGVASVYADSGDGYHRKIHPANLAAQIPVSWFAGQVSNAQVPVGAVNQHRATILANPALTGTATAPTPPPGTNNSQIATTAFVQATASIGYGQSWTNPGKVANATYTNSTGRPIEVLVCYGIGGGGNVNVVVGGVQIASFGNGSSADNEGTISFTVPAGSTYRVNASGTRTGISRWSELV